VSTITSFEASDGSVHTTPVKVNKDRRFALTDPNSDNVVARDISGLHLRLPGFGFSAGGATSISAPLTSNVEVVNGADVDVNEAGETVLTGYNRKVKVGE